MGKPKIVCLCGSTRFSRAYQKANLEETLAGKIVLTIGCDMRSDVDLFADKTEAELDEIKAGLDQLHLRKIDMADEVLILNVDGYAGQSTRREIRYAIERGKTIRWYEPKIDWYVCPDCGSQEWVVSAIDVEDDYGNPDDFLHCLYCTAEFPETMLKSSRARK